MKHLKIVKYGMGKEPSTIKEALEVAGKIYGQSVSTVRSRIWDTRGGSYLIRENGWYFDIVQA